MSTNRERRFEGKIVLIGDPATGKTSLIRKYVQDQFEKDYIPSIGVNLSKQPLHLNINDQLIHINLTLWDIAAQEIFNFMHSTFYKGANGVVIVFDLTQKSSLAHVLSWHAEAVHNGVKKKNICLIGNKADLAETRAITGNQIQSVMSKLDISSYYETSAMNGQNVQTMFESLASRMLFDNV